jgi:hypothetical protein
MILFIIIILIILIIFYLINKIFYINLNKEYFDIDEYKKKMLENNNKKLYKLSLNSNIKILSEDCDDKCNKADCIKLKQRSKLLDKCIQCNSQPNKCFNKSIIGGNCDDCDITDINKKMNCSNIENYGCPNPNNLNTLEINEGIQPYYIQIPDNNVNSPYNKKCVFCWNILDNI